MHNKITIKVNILCNFLYFFFKMTQKNSISNIEKQKHILCTLSKCKPKMRKAILMSADKELITAICESIFNMLNSNLDINRETLTKLKPFKKTFRKLVSKSTLANKKKILIQKGGFLEFLVPAVISGISSIVSSIISANNSS
jgi:hypothetical protein